VISMCRLARVGYNIYIYVYIYELVLGEHPVTIHAKLYLAVHRCGGRGYSLN
jgi:hypothetical protein